MRECIHSQQKHGHVTHWQAMNDAGTQPSTASIAYLTLDVDVGTVSDEDLDYVHAIRGDGTVESGLPKLAWPIKTRINQKINQKELATI